MAVNPTVERRVIDRWLFAAAAIVFPLIILAGFARTYYFKFFFNTPTLPLLNHLHGFVMTTWVALFVTQVWLISKRRIKTHQLLGFAAIGIAALILIIGFLLATKTAKFGSPSSPVGVPRLQFLIIPLTDLLNFAILFTAAILLRKRSADHKRLMLLTIVNFLPPAVARIPIPSLAALGPLWFFGFSAALALIALIVDWRLSGKMNKVFLIAVLLLISTFVLRLVFMGTVAWMRLATWLTTWGA
jgi:hypothetical protein